MNNPGEAVNQLAALRWSRIDHTMVSTGLFSSDAGALEAYGMLRRYAEQAGLDDARQMGMLSQGAQVEMEGRSDAAATHAYRFHLPLIVFNRMKQEHPALFHTSTVSAAAGTGIAH